VARVTASEIMQAVARLDLGDLSAAELHELMAHLVRVHGTRRDRSAMNKAAWSAGDRTPWGGKVKRRDPRRGWRNFKGRER
jgi:hypothetical protein